MLAGTHVIVTFAESDDLDPSPGTIIDIIDRSGELLYKVEHEDGSENWYPEKWLIPLLKSVN